MGTRFVDRFDSLVIAGLALSAFALVFLPTIAAPASTETGPDRPIFKQLREVQWAKMLPELGDASPEMAILHEDARTHATQIADPCAESCSHSQAPAFGK